MPTEIAGFNETAAAELFAPDATFNLQCQMSSLIIDTFLAGVLVMQLITYFTYQKSDKTWTKLLVLYIALMNTVVTVYYWVFSQYLLVQNFGKWLPWLETRWLENMPVFDVMTVSVVQGFFAHRAFCLAKRNWFVLVGIGILIAASFGGGIGVKVIFHDQPSLLGASNTGVALILWLATTTAADLIIAVVILHALFKSKSGWAHTDRLVTRLIRMVFEAQLPPTVLALAYVIEWSREPSSLLGAVFQALQSKAYSVGLLFTLNARIQFQTQTSNNFPSTAPQVFGLSVRNGTMPAEVHMTVETETFHEAPAYRNGSADKHVTDKDKDVESISTLEGDKTLGYSNNSRARLTRQDSAV